MNKKAEQRRALTERYEAGKLTYQAYSEALHAVNVQGLPQRPQTRAVAPARTPVPKPAPVVKPRVTPMDPESAALLRASSEKLIAELTASAARSSRSRRDELLAMTPLGLEVLEKTKANTRAWARRQNGLRADAEEVPEEKPEEEAAPDGQPEPDEEKEEEQVEQARAQARAWALRKNARRAGAR